MDREAWDQPGKLRFPLEDRTEGEIVSQAEAWLGLHLWEDLHLAQLPLRGQVWKEHARWRVVRR